MHHITLDGFGLFLIVIGILFLIAAAIVKITGHKPDTTHRRRRHHH